MTGLCDSGAGPTSTHRVPSVGTQLAYLVHIDGHKVAHYTDDPLAAAHHAAKAKAHDTEQNVVIVVLTAEEAAFTDEQVRVRPFYPSPAEQAEEALATHKQRQPHVLVGSAAASNEKERIA